MSWVTQGQSAKVVLIAALALACFATVQVLAEGCVYPGDMGVRGAVVWT